MPDGAAAVDDEAGTAGLVFGVAIKYADQHVDVDPLSGEVTAATVPGRTGTADLAALEVALRLRDAWGGRVVVACAGPARAEPLLRDALARGADHAVRVAVSAEVPGAGFTVPATARALAVAFDGADVVVCGDYSSDGGSGAVPGLLAAATGRAQALGLVSVSAEAGDEPGTVRAERRLDRGRRELLRVRAPMVLSVEGSAARPRRAPMSGLLAAREAAIDVRTVRRPAAEPAVTLRAYRPRAHLVPPPAGVTGPQRVEQLLGAGADREPPRLVVAEPAEAAREILDQLQRWGYT
jgi:electron transfer flavoprotein beta subunit